MSEVVNVTIFDINELSESAKQTAHYDWMSNGDYAWGDENRKTLKEFEKIFPIDVKDWEYGGNRRGYVRFCFTGDDGIDELTGIRLATYLQNNYGRYLTKGKFYHKNKKSRHSKVIFDNCCPLTGYYMDEEILQPIYEFIKQPHNNLTFYELMEECLNKWAKACEEDYEGYFSMDSFVEMCEANDWKFHEDGKFYRTR